MVLESTSRALGGAGSSSCPSNLVAPPNYCVRLAAARTCCHLASVVFGFSPPIAIRGPSPAQSSLLTAAASFPNSAGHLSPVNDSPCCQLSVLQAVPESTADGVTFQDCVVGAPWRAHVSDFRSFSHLLPPQSGVSASPHMASSKFPGAVPAGTAPGGLARVSNSLTGRCLHVHKLPDLTLWSALAGPAHLGTSPTHAFLAPAGA